MILALLAMRKNNVEKAESRLMNIKDPDRALVRRERASYYFLLGAIRSQRNLSESEKLFKKALEIGLSRQEQAMAKLQLQPSPCKRAANRKPNAWSTKPSAWTKAICSTNRSS